MKKKIFLMIGIIIASTITFTGGVIGVMALMGKFKEPVIYPEKLYFENNEQVIETTMDDSNQIDLNYLYSFKLVGTSKDGEVNQTECDLSFMDSISAQLITLCDKDGNELESVGKKYRVDCNSVIYYKLRNISDNNYYNNGNYGKVRIKAVDARNMISTSSSNDLTIRIDRVVKNIGLSYNEATYVDSLTKSISVGVGTPVDFIFNTYPSYALKPISDIDSKQVEIFYHQNLSYGENLKQYDGDILPINEETIRYLNFISYSEEKQCYVFETDQPGTYEFRLGVFESYSQKEYYDSQNLDENNIQKLGHMVNKTIYITVANVEVSEVNFDLSTLNLSLYQENELILNSTDEDKLNFEGNLGLTIRDRNGIISTNDERYSKFSFNLDNWRENSVRFIYSDNTNNSKSYIDLSKVNLTWSASLFEIKGANADSYSNISITKSNITLSGGLTFEIELGNLIIGNKRNIKNIKYTYDGRTYTFICNGGEAFIDDEGNISVLKTYYYLGFFSYDSANEIYTYVDEESEEFKYAVVDLNKNAAGNSSWKVVAKSEIKDGTNLKLVAFVVNTESDLCLNAISVNVEPDTTKVIFGGVEKVVNLKVEYVEKSDEIAQSHNEVAFEELVGANDKIINSITGTYTKFVLITKEMPKDYQYPIEVCKSIIYNKDGNYVLVGYFDEGTNKFHNVLKPTGEGDVSVEVYLLGLKTNYNETIEHMIESIFNPDLTSINLNSSQISDDSNVADGYKITIKVKYDWLVNKANYKFLKDSYTLPEDYDTNGGNYFAAGAEGDEGKHTAYFVTDVENMFVNLKKTMNLVDLTNPEQPDYKAYFSFIYYDKDGNVLTNHVEYAQITSVVDYTKGEGDSNEGFTINYHITSSDVYSLKIVFECDGVTKQSDYIYVKSTAPTGIKYVKSIATEDTEEVSYEVSNLKLVATIAYEPNRYVYSYKLVNSSEDDVKDGTLSEIFNEVSGDVGFKVVQPFNIARTLVYSSNNESIFSTETGAKRVGETTSVTISCGGQTVTLPVEVTASGFNFSLTDKKSETTTKDSNIKLSNLMNYIYDAVDPSIKTTKEIELFNFVVTYNGQATTYSYNEENNTYTFTQNSTEVLTIERTFDENGYTFTRGGNSYVKIEVRFNYSTITGDSGSYTLIFSSDISISTNYEWNNLTVYQNTEVMLSQQYNSTPSSDNKPIFVIVTPATSLYTPICTSENSEFFSKTSQSTYYKAKFTEPGVYYINFEISSGNKIYSGNGVPITVLPNVIIGEEKTIDTSSVQSASLLELVELKEYQTSDIVYGLNGTMYSNDYLTGITTSSSSYENISLGLDGTGITQSDSNYTIPKVTKINTTETKSLKVKYNSTLVGTVNVNLKAREVAVKDSITLNDLSKLTLSDFISTLDLTLSEIKIELENKTITLNSSFKLSEYTTETVYPTKITLTFINNETLEIVNYEEQVSIVPFTPTLTENIITIISEENFNVLEGVFDADSLDLIEKDENILSLVVKVDGRDADIFGINENNLGYSEGKTYTTTISIPKLNANKKLTTITYILTYSNSRSYEFNVNVKIVNNQEVTINYPFKDISNNGNTIYFSLNGVELSEVDDLFERNVNNGIVLKTGYKTGSYEPVLVQGTGSTKVRFDYDETMNIERASISNNGKIDSVQIVGYQYQSALANYLNNGNVVIDKSSITFKSGLPEESGYFIVVKVISNSGAYGYYILYIYNPSNNLYAKANEVYSGDCVVKEFGKTESDKIVSFDELSVNDLYLEASDLSATMVTDVNKANLKFYLLNAVETATGKQILRDKYGSLLNGKEKLPKLYNYTIVTLGLVYNMEGNTKINCGRIIVYVTPEVTEIKGSVDSHNSFTGEKGVYTYTINTGKGIYDNPISVNGVTLQKVTLKTEDLDLSDYLISILNGENLGKIKFEKYLAEDLEFDIIQSYEIETDKYLEVKIHYIYKAVNITADETTKYVGEYVNGSGFENFYNLTDNVLNGYKGEIKINGNTIDLGSTEQSEASYFTKIENVTEVNFNSLKSILYKKDGDKFVSVSSSTYVEGTYYILSLYTDNYEDCYLTINDGKYYLKFTSNNVANDKDVIITFKDYPKEVSKTLKFHIYSGVYVSDLTGNAGSSKNTPYDATKTSSDLYKSEVGSYITISPTPKAASNLYDEYTTYSVGELKIVSNIGISLNYLFDEEASDKHVISIDDNKITFIHMPEDYVLMLTISPKKDDNACEMYNINNGKVDSVNFYVNVKQTYYGIKSVYLKDGSQYESIKEETTISNLRSYLFGSYVKLGKIDEATFTSLKDNLYTYNGSTYTAVGLNNYNSTTEYYYVEYPKVEYIKLGKIDKATFTSLKDNLYTYDNSKYTAVGDIYIANTDYYQKVSYKTRIVLLGNNDNNIVTDFDAEKMGFTNKNNLNYINFECNYITTVTKSDLGVTIPNYFEDNNDLVITLSNAVGLSKQYKVKVVHYDKPYEYLLDANGIKNGVNYISMLTDESSENTKEINVNDVSYTIVYGGVELQGSENQLTYVPILNLIDTESLLIQSEEEKVLSFSDGIYSITSDPYILKLKMNEENQLCVALLKKGIGSQNPTFKISIYGENGWVINNLELRFYNYSVEYTNGNSYYAQTDINMADIVKISEISGSTSTPVTFDSAKFNSGSYTVNGIKTIISNIENCDLFESTSNNVLKTYAVGEQVSVQLTYNVEVSDYIIKVVDLQFYIEPNIVFNLNGEIALKDSTTYSNYYLASRNIDANGDVVDDLKTTQSDNSISTTSGTYYNDLIIMNRVLKEGLNENVDKSLFTDVTITLVGNYNNTDVSIVDNVLKFKKDYSGEVTLKIEFNAMSFGKFEVTWVLNVVGFVTMEYRNGTFDGSEYVVLGGNGLSSGDVVYPVYEGEVDDYYSYLDYSTTSNKLIGGSSVINSTINTSIASRKYYYYVLENLSTVSQSDINKITNWSYLTYTSFANGIKLPAVPQSTNKTCYTVIVKFTISYTVNNNSHSLSNSGTYYAVYRVYNEQKVNALNTNSSVNVNDVVLSGSNLRLFYYAYQWTSGTDVYTLTTDGTNYYLTIPSKTISVNVSSVDESFNVTFEDGTYTYTVNLNEKTLTLPGQTNPLYAEIITNKNTLFKCEFENIQDYVEFLNSVTKITLTDCEGLKVGVTKSYSLTKLSDDTFAINLRENLAENEQLFTNELKAQLNVKSNNEIIRSIPKFEDNVGFRLYSNTQITAKSSDVVYLSDIFNNWRSSGLDEANVNSIRVIGIGTEEDPSAKDNWVTGGTGAAPQDTGKTIEVGSTTYYIYTITYIGSGSGSELCDVQQVFYYVKGANKISIVDYSSASNSSLYTCTYTTDTSETTFNCAGIIKTFEMNKNGNGLKVSNSDPEVSNSDPKPIALTNSSYSDYVTISGNNIKVEVQNYKNANSSATTLTLSFKLNNDDNLILNIRFELPNTTTVSAS